MNFWQAWLFYSLTFVVISVGVFLFCMLVLWIAGGNILTLVPLVLLLTALYTVKRLRKQ